MILLKIHVHTLTYMAGAFVLIARHSGLLCVLMHWYVVTPVICESRAQSCYHGNCSSTIPLYIGGMLSMTVGWDGTGCLVAAELAMEQINNRSDILQGYELRMASKDTQVRYSKLSFFCSFCR